MASPSDQSSRKNPANQDAGPSGGASPLASKLRVFLRGLLFIASLVALAYLVDVAHLLDKAWIDEHVRGQGFGGEVLFVAVAALFTAIGLPRQLVAFLAGYGFGLVEGGLLGLLGALLGCMGAFYYARLFGRGFIAARFPRRVQKIDEFIHENPLSMTLLIRLLPVGSNLVTNLAAGVSSVRAVPFFSGSALGYIPQTVIFALAGSGIALQPVFRIGLAVALFIASGALGVYLYHRYRRGHRLDDVDRKLGEADEVEADAGNDRPGGSPPGTP
ncbi:MAG TPA: VTT domain-containing protein [Gammaproteobacteria bacterium]|nr:VTT domain-containing protein [Gammaproteobacteria bacterium]